MKEEISLIDLLKIIQKRLVLIISLGFVGLLLSFIYTFYMVTPQYSATTQILVSQRQSVGVIQQSDINTNLQLIDTYKDIIKGPVILDDVREELDLDLTHVELSNKIDVLNESDSQVFLLQVTDANPYDAATIANTTAERFQENVHEIMNVDNVTIISEAIPNTNAVSPNKVQNLAIGLLLAVIFGIGLVLFLEMLDTTVKDEKFITGELGWPILGRISELKPTKLTKTELKSKTVSTQKQIESESIEESV